MQADQSPSREAVARAIYEGLYSERGGLWECVEPNYQDQVWGKIADAILALLTPATPQPATGEVSDAVDSGMSSRSVERAELLWANLPTGTKWHY